MSAPSQPPPGARPVKQPGGYNFWIVGEERTPLRDLYHNFLQWRWPASLALIAAGFFAVNLVFATVYFAIGGVDNMHAGSFWDALVFSVETLGTIGYGVMSPKSPAANSVMMIEAVTGLIVTALATGLVFTKFARATARVAFTSNVVITTHEGKPTLMFRLGNQRSNTIVEARLIVTLSLTRTTAEGETFYKMHDVKLVRDRMAGMRRGWVAMHVIDETSPLFGLDSAALEKQEAEIEVSLSGMDDVMMATVHTSHLYTDKQILFGHRFADTIRTIPGTGGDMILDLTQFDVTLPDSVPRDSVAA
jgi:inward rectifier potassium channel